MTLRHTSLRPLFVVAVTLLALVAAQSAASQAEEEYIPFVTDFGGAPSAGQSEYIPFVTDFPRSPVEPTPVSTPAPFPAPRETLATESGFDWAAAGIGAGAAFALVAFALGTGLAVRGRARVARA